MRRAPSASPIRLLRRVLLGLLGVLIAGLVGLYLLGRPQPIDESAETDSLADAPGNERDAIAWSEGFEFEQKVAGRTAFSLRGDRFASDREGITRLEGVVLELARGEETYRVRSRRATWDPDGREARLSGEVRLEGGRGFWLESPRLDLVGEGKTLVSREPVRFGSGRGVEGRANALRFDVEDDRLVLRGRVRAARPAAADREPLSFEAEQVVYLRGAARIRAQGQVEVVSGADRVRAHEVNVELDGDGETPRRVLAYGQVAGGVDPDLEEDQAPPAGDGDAVAAGATGETAPSPGEAATPAAEPGQGAGEPDELDEEVEPGAVPGRLRFRSDVARIDLGAPDGGIRSIELEALEQEPARIAFRVDEKTTRTLRAPRITAEVENGELTGAAAEGGVQIRERILGDAKGSPQRTATSERARAAFTATGELATVELEGAVELHEPGLDARGESAVLDVVTGAGRLVGGERRAWARSTKGELLAPEILYARDGGEVEARGGVYATLVAGAGKAVRLGPSGGGEDDDEPVRVESATAVWRQQGGRWEFRGDVRAAQGERLLFADRLEGSETSGDMLAEGEVRTRWSQPGRDGGAPTSTAVSAERLRYLAEPGRAEYEGGVEVRQLERELDSERLVVELDDDGRARRMVATGGVTIVDRESGRRVEGTTAEHDLVAETILVEGEPVVLSERDGSKLRGPRLLYDVATGSARMIGSGESR